MNIIHRCAASPAFWFGTCLVCAGVVSNLGAIGAGPASAIAEDEDKVESTILREGTRIENRQAEVRQEAERLAVYLDGSRTPLLTLENLAMQRLTQSILDDPADQNWLVTGTITEFQGRNYLLLERIARATR